MHQCNIPLLRIPHSSTVIVGTGHKMLLFISINIADILPPKCNCFNFPHIRSCSSLSCPLNSFALCRSTHIAREPLPLSYASYPSIRTGPRIFWPSSTTEIDLLVSLGHQQNLCNKRGSHAETFRVRDFLIFVAQPPLFD